MHSITVSHIHTNGAPPPPVCQLITSGDSVSTGVAARSRQAVCYSIRKYKEGRVSVTETYNLRSINKTSLAPLFFLSFINFTSI